MCSETGSPRLSFSYHLGDSDVLPLKQDDKYSEEILAVGQLTPDFEFSICNSLEHQPSSADELFSNGVILPLQMNQKKNFTHKESPHGENPSVSSSLAPQSCPPSVDKAKKDNCSEEITDVQNPPLNQKSQSKSFWVFNRSKSLNSDAKKRLLRSFPLLSRSNSTGSAQNPKKNEQKHNQHKQSLMTKSSSSSSWLSSSPCALSFYSKQQKPPLSKSYGGSYSHGVRVSPILNVPPPYFSKGTANLFGLGSILRCGKDKRNKR